MIKYKPFQYLIQIKLHKSNSLNISLLIMLKVEISKLKETMEYLPIWYVIIIFS